MKTVTVITLFIGIGFIYSCTSKTKKNNAVETADTLEQSQPANKQKQSYDSIKKLNYTSSKNSKKEKLKYPEVY